MDFIEQWLHLSPDGGNGALEACYAIAIAAGVLLLLQRAIASFTRAIHFSIRFGRR
ncbi:MAG: hypothetical protein WA814_02045 [Candidatus Baltobacteraceae bacterium]